MFTLDNWHQLRGLALLAILGLFLLYFVLTGLWLNFRARQRIRGFVRTGPTGGVRVWKCRTETTPFRRSAARPVPSSPDTNQARHAA